ncbi:hypothetical protein AB0L42_40805 [Streptomyces sp. NPDC052287]|uniref:hypothetical protein n=1 Tax=Streptomyces sp. NPDC052287 TaxID=3154950 RepID=UPI00343ACDF9
MAFAESSNPLVEAERLRKVARGARRPSSVPLLVFGALTLGYAAFAGDISIWSMLYWSVAGPAGLFLVAWWYRQRQFRTGVGPGRAPYAKAGLILLASFALIIPLTAVQLPTVGLVLLVLAVRQRNTYLGVFAVAVTVMGILGTFTATLENAMYHAADGLGWFRQEYGYFDGAPTIITVTAALLLLAGGLVALQRERRASA